MAATDIQISTRHAYNEGEKFGDVGAYEEIRGRVTFSVNPLQPINDNIVDLKLAPRDEAGLVSFSCDFVILAPADLRRGNNTLLVDIPNRGRRLLSGSFNRQPVIEPEDANLPGDGFLFEKGFTQVSIGWQWDVDEDQLLGLAAPEALINDQPVMGQLISRFRPDRDQASLRIVQLGKLKPSYPVSLEGDHHLYFRRWEDDEPVEIPQPQWRFARVVDGIEQSSDVHINLTSGFRKGCIYELVYETAAAPIVGTGLLAVREVAAWLKNDNTLLAKKLTHAIAFGVSQTGRLLNQLLYEGLNTDQRGNQVYDGLFIHIAGAQRGEFNHRFAQPTVLATPSFGQRFPFSPAKVSDPWSDELAGLINTRHQPRIFHVNTSWEYWRGDASLLHTTPDGSQDLTLPDNVRCFHVAGTHHIGGLLIDGQQIDMLPTGARTAHGMNIVNFQPLMRRLLCQLHDWIVNGVLPNQSRYPSLRDETAWHRSEVLKRFTALKHIQTLNPERLSSIRKLTLGPREAEGIGEYPAKQHENYACLVSAVDESLNEVAGIRLPDITLPVATHTGWNARAAESGAGDQAAAFAGFSDFFPNTATAADPRQPIRERYVDRLDYQTRVELAITELHEQGWILAEDKQWILDNSLQRYDLAIKHGNG